MNRHVRSDTGGDHATRIRPALGAGAAFCFVVTVIAGAPASAARRHPGVPVRWRAAALVEWNAVTSDALSIDSALGPPVMGVGLAYVEAAVYNAVQGLTGDTSCTSGQAWSRPCVDRAAIAAAARGVLVEQFPASEARVEAAYTDALAEIPDGPKKTAGLRYGERAARHLLRARRRRLVWDRWSGIARQRRGLAPNPSGFRAIRGPMAVEMTPFLLRSADEFRPGPPPALTSDEYTADFLEVAEIGSATSATRTEEQTEIARFYSASLPVQLQGAFRDHVMRHCLNVSDAARYFAVGSLNTADSQIAGGDTKFHYGTWRPVTAIQEADTDGNPDTNARSRRGRRS